MALDFATVRFLRVLIAVVGALIGAGAGMKYFPSLSIISIAIGGLIGFVVGWNIPDLFKGWTQK